MLRTALLVCLLSGGLLPALAQQDSTNNTNGMNGMNGMNGAAEAVPVDSIYVRDTDTLHYTYTPAPAAATASVPVASDSLPRRRPSFLRRIVNYFGESTTDKTFEKKIDFTFAGGPSYSKNTSLGIGVLAAGLYRLDRSDSVTSPSNVSIFASVSITGFYAVGVTGNNIFAQNRSRIDYSVDFKSQPRDIWGVGYRAGAYGEKGNFVEKRYNVDVRYLYRVLPNTFIGGMLGFDYTKGKKFSDLSYITFDGVQQKTGYTATGIGAIIEYDSRDFIPNPFRGIYISLVETFYPKPLGNCGQSLWRTNFTADFYQRVWRDGILAIDLYGEFNSDGTPWSMLARMGGSQRMRGYYEGQYTDNGMITFQVELRQRIWRRIGCTVWGGAGNVFHRLSTFNWSETLPNYGIGLRWELKKRTNVRLDYGFGRKTSGFMLNINEAF